MSWTTAPDGEMSPTDLHIYALEQATKNKVKRGRSMIITPSLLRV